MLLSNTRLVRGVARIGDDAEVCFRPTVRQLPRGGHGTNNVIAALNDDGWDMADEVDPTQQLILISENPWLVK